MTRRPNRQPRGFTLLELMLALTMTAMLALTMYSTMSIAMRARRSANQSVQQVRAATIVMDIVCRDLESALPPTGVLAGAFIGTHQSGGSSDADIVEFYCVARDGDKIVSPLSDGIRRVELALRTDVNPPTLVRHVTRNLLPRTTVDPDEEILCQGVKSFSLRYYDGSAWQDSWDSSTMGDVLPLAIQVVLELEETDPNNPAPAGANRVTRIIPLSCGKLPDEDTAEGGILP